MATKRRGTVVEEAQESLIDGAQASKQKPKKTFKEKLSDFGGQLYNKQYREFLERDSKAWFKLSAFYFVFYLLLSCFFLILVLILYAILDLKQPTYYNDQSVMASRNKINPGMGFRPQPDPEYDIIDLSESSSKKYYQSLENFLKPYERNKENNFTGAHGFKVTYNYEDAIKNTPCSRENQYGLNSTKPCVVVKLNKIFGWLPGKLSSPPLNITGAEKASKYFVYIACNGENSADRDNVGQLDYYSSYPGTEIGGIDFKYFPYRNQPGYLQPLVFVHFKSLSVNTLINVECKAYAKNIDNTDKVNKRGMVKFQLFIRR